MDKRYQVFVSSTFADLREERQQVTQTLIEMDCIPAGMELFPAVDEEQWEFIKRVIDDCDYYLLIIGGRYGTLTSEGISYTEKEFNYAETQGLKIVALLHDDPGSIPVNKSDTDPNLRKKLSIFRDKVSSKRLVRFWSSARELPGLVALSISKTIKMYPAEGWVRANRIANEDALRELNHLRRGIAEESLQRSRLRHAINACEGWWLEQIRIPEKDFYSFTWMVYDGERFTKSGINFDPGTPMDGTRYSGELVTSLFPTLLSLYSNDLHSHDYYTDGIFRIEMQLDPSGEYTQYEGRCYDKLGLRDEITGQKLSESLSLDSFYRMSAEEKQAIVEGYFPNADLTRGRTLTAGQPRDASRHG